MATECTDFVPWWICFAFGALYSNAEYLAIFCNWYEYSSVMRKRLSRTATSNIIWALKGVCGARMLTNLFTSTSTIRVYEDWDETSDMWTKYCQTYFIFRLYNFIKILCKNFKNIHFTRISSVSPLCRIGEETKTNLVSQLLQADLVTRTVR